MTRSSLTLSFSCVVAFGAVHFVHAEDPISSMCEQAEIEAAALARSDLSMQYDRTPSGATVSSTGAEQYRASLTMSNVHMGMLQDNEDALVPPADDGSGGEPNRDQTGTDPRDFSTKFMPYYRFTELENGIEVQTLTVFGMYAFTPKFAMTYELPIVKNLDYGDFGPFEAATGGTPSGGGFSDLPTGGTSFSDLESDGDVIGMGDLGLRFFYNLDWGGQIDDENTWSLFPLVEMLFPTATDDVLGGEAWIISPGFVVVADIPGDAPFGLGFFAMMNFFDFDVIKSNDRSHTTRYRGRWFWMQPLSKPGPGIFDGIYSLIELQPVYDFETDDFDIWVGPEVGKIVNKNLTIYAKPGWGIDTEPEDRDFTFEVGCRIFFN